MMRHTSRILPTALAAVLVLGACGSADDDAAPDLPAEAPSDGDLRAPTPVEFTTGGASDAGSARSASAEGAVVADDMMIAPYFDIEYVLGEGLVAPTDDIGYVFDATAELSVDAITRLAGALGVEGEPVRIDDGYSVSWRVGPDDGSAPSLWVSDDAQQWWSYSSPWSDEGTVHESCEVSIDSDGRETVEECPEPEPPTGVPTAEEAEQRARELLSALGVDPAGVRFEAYADEWFASVTANDATDARTALISWNFGFGADGVLQYAGGSLGVPVPVGPYPLVDIATAFQRLQDQTFGGFVGGPAMDTAVATAEASVEPDMPISEEMVIEPLPVEPVDGSLPEPETVTVTLVDVQADLWWAWDVDGTVWLLPAYRFIGDDGGWYTVPAVTDEFLIQVDPPVVEEPLPVEPGEGGGSSEPGEPPLALPVDDLAPLVGATLADFTAKAEDAGWTVRVVEVDGEALAVTDDFRTDRVNVAVVTVGGVEQVVRVTLDDGTLIAEAPIEPPTVLPTVPTTEPTTEPTEPGTEPTPSPVPVTGLYEGVAFYPACGDETLTHEGTTWYQVHESDFPDEWAAIFATEREEAVGGDPSGFARVAPPEPGDDTGTLVVWSDGVARFVSDSGDLTAWLIDDELTYDWVC